MFESLTGTPPFQGDSAFEIMYKHMSVAPPKLLSWAKNEKEKTLAGLIDRCLEKDPFKRPQSAEEMQAVLKEISAADFSSFSAPARTQSTIFLVISTIIILNLVLLAVLFKLPAKNR